MAGDSPGAAALAPTVAGFQKVIAACAFQLMMCEFQKQVSAACAFQLMMCQFQ